MQKWNPLTIFLFCLNWPLSHICGMPPEMSEPMPWQRTVKLAGFAILIASALTISVLVADKLGWIN